MQFAQHNDIRIKAQPGAHGRCPGCGAEVIAKCGTQKVWHWAHKGRRHCDHWWENETQWHREWKNKFPSEWQEKPARDDNGELHIADIKTPTGLVVEFQRSYLDLKEARTRTAFHRRIIWIVDGTRLEATRLQFENALADGRKHRTKIGIVNQISFTESRLLMKWAQVGVIVGFDFGGETVWLLRRIKDNSIYGFEYPKSSLVRTIADGNGFPDVIFAEQPRRPTRQLISQPTRYRRRFVRL